MARSISSNHDSTNERTTISDFVDMCENHLDLQGYVEISNAPSGDLPLINDIANNNDCSVHYWENKGSYDVVIE